MPATLPNVQEIVRLLHDSAFNTVKLLVVPESGWTKASLATLSRLASDGVTLAGHGWCHEVQEIRGLKHRLHSLLISRNVAEHLSLKRSAIIELMQRNYEWFDAHHLPPPELYVPPAWAMGDVTRSDLDELPFTYYETFSGVYDSSAGRFRRLPLLGFEADTGFRALCCRTWNALNRRLSSAERPLRISIHPNDLELKLRRDLRQVLQLGGLAIAYNDHTVQDSA